MAEALDLIDAGQHEYRIFYPENGQNTFLTSGKGDRYGWIVSIGSNWVRVDELDNSPADTVRAMIDVMQKVGLHAEITGKDGNLEKVMGS